MKIPRDSPQDAQGVALRLSAQRALLDHVPASLRCASVAYEGTQIQCCFVFDGGESEADRELLSCAATEIIADFPDPYTLHEDYLSVPSPAKAPGLQYLVYRRHEATDT